MPPYPGIPYGPAPAWCFPLFECSLYLLFIWCMFTAIKKGPRDVWYLLGGVSFGLLLEYMEVAMGNYTYGHFWIMVGKAPFNIPFCIGIGWGIVMYSARLFTNALGLSILTAAALDTLLALNIDVSMDVVAYRTHMWHWYWNTAMQNPLTTQWFGIPYGNFIGWQTVVFCYSAFSRFFEQYFQSKKTAFSKFFIVAALALLCAIAVLYLTELLWPLLEHLGLRASYRFAGLCILLLVLVGFGWRKKTKIAESMPAVVWWVPGWFHLVFISLFFILGFYTENKWMTTTAIANLLIGLILHVWPVYFKGKA